VHRTQCYTKRLSKSKCIRSFMCDKSWLSGTSNVHEHYVSDTAGPKRADEAQLAQWLVNGTDDFELINLKPWSSLFIISLAQRTVIPTLCPYRSTTFIFRRLEPESFAEKIGRKIEYKILLEWKWLIQTLLRINTEKMYKPRETCVLFVNQTLYKTLLRFLTVCHVVQNALYIISVTHISTLTSGVPTLYAYWATRTRLHTYCPHRNQASTVAYVWPHDGALGVEINP